MRARYASFLASKLGERRGFALSWPAACFDFFSFSASGVLAFTSSNDHEARGGGVVFASAAISFDAERIMDFSTVGQAGGRDSSRGRQGQFQRISGGFHRDYAG